MKIASTSALALLLTNLCLLQAQQKLTITSGCNYADGQSATQTIYTFDPPAEIAEVAKHILDQAAIKTMPFIIKSADVSNAKATTVDNQRYILINQTFISDFKKDARTKWAAHALLAHEVAHHVLGHQFNLKDNKQRKNQEFEADKWAGVVMARLGATRDEALAGIRNFAKADETVTHPPKDAREQAMGIAFDEEAKILAQKKNPGNEKIPVALDRSVFNKPNLVESAIAVIDDEKVTITVFLPGTLNGHALRICLKSNNENLVPGVNNESSLNGLGENIPFTARKTIVWNYAMDKRGKQEASQPELLRVYVFDMNAAAPGMPPGDKAILGAFGVVGLGGLGYGIAGMIQGKNLYKLYRDVRNEDAPQYAAESRETRYDSIHGKSYSDQRRPARAQPVRRLAPLLADEALRELPAGAGRARPGCVAV